jgi:hypothetical protein
MIRLGAKSIFSTFAILLVLSMSGCEIPSTITINTNTGSGSGSGSGSSTQSFSCSATVQNSTVQSGVAFPVTVRVSETPTAYPPYSIAGQSGTFSSSTTVSESFTNPTTSNEIESESFSVSDSNGNVTSCSVSVTVLPSSSSSTTGLSCQIEAYPLNVHVGDPVNFIMTASNGVPNYTFSSFNAGTASQTIQSLTTVSATEATASASYTTAGLPSATVLVTDSDGNQATCSQSITVKDQPSVTVVASPAASEPASDPITLTASTDGFFGTPTFSFTTTEPGINIVPNGNIATVTATDGANHNFYVTATANSQTSTNQDQAYRTINLQFVTTVPLNCTVTPSTTKPTVGQTVTFTVTSSNNVPVQFTQFTTDGTIIGEPATNTIEVQYGFAGSQSVSALAVASSNGEQCNNGSTLQSSVTIQGNPNCSASFSQNPATYGSPVTLSVSVPSTYESGAVQITNIAPSSSSTNEPLWVGGLISALSADVAFYGDGSWPVTVTVQDNAGNQAQCSATEVVNQ